MDAGETLRALYEFEVVAVGGSGHTHAVRVRLRPPPPWLAAAGAGAADPRPAWPLAQALVTDHRGTALVAWLLPHPAGRECQAGAADWHRAVVEAVREAREA